VLIAAMVASAWAATAAAIAGEAALASRILEATGVKGGLVVHLGCGDGTLTAALRANDSYVVHGLDASGDNVRQAREHIRSRGLYGPVSVGVFEARRLPYADSLVNLLVSEDLGEVAMPEVMRVLCPGGVAYVEQSGKWTKTVKPRPKEIDEWTHYLHDAGGNAVANDTVVGPPRRIQWAAGPKFARHHDALASLSAMVSSGGRLFYIYDEAPVSLIHRPPDWKLIARDAFNGTLLWKRGIPRWLTHLWYFRSGPVWLSRRLVAEGSRVYATLGIEAPVTVLDAATGSTILAIDGTDRTEEFVVHRGRLLAVRGDPKGLEKDVKKVHYYRQNILDRTPDVQKTILACDAATGKTLWQKDDPQLAHLVPLSLCARGERVFYLDGENLCCVKLQDGNALWQAPFPTKGLFLRNYAPTVIATATTVLCLSQRRLAAFNAADGKLLWEKKGYIGFASPGDLFVIGQTAWTQSSPERERSEGVTSPFLADHGKELWGIDIRTGRVTTKLSRSKLLPGGHHHRCYRNKATSRYLICGRRAVEFIDLAQQKHEHHWWIRGECQYGILPCNGLLYVPPDPCACFGHTKLNGLFAFTAKDEPVGAGNTPVLVKGPAFGAAAAGGDTMRHGVPDPPRRAAPDASRRRAPGSARLWSAGGIARDHDWPTYRHDMARSGGTPSRLHKATAELWRRRVGRALGGVTSADGRVFVPDVDAHTIHCLDAARGTPLWRFVADGRVDSPPTIWSGLALFGCRSGHVYAVRTTDGALAWRVRVAPQERRIVNESQLESAWPVHGSVLVLDGVAYCAAGHCSNLSGGIVLKGIRIADGRVLYETTVRTSARRAGPIGTTADLLVSDGRSIVMKSSSFSRDLSGAGGSSSRVLRTTGFLESSGFHRRQWALGPGGKNYRTPWGRLLVFDGQQAYGVQSPYAYLRATLSMWPLTHKGHHHQQFSKYAPEQFPVGVRIYAQKNRPVPRQPKPKDNIPAELNKPRYVRFSRPGVASTLSHTWTHMLPVQVTAMVLAGDVLALAGRDDAVQLAGSAPPAKAVLLLVDTKDGRTLVQHDLPAPPVFDGMAVARGRLYVPMRNGEILCLSDR